MEVTMAHSQEDEQIFDANWDGPHEADNLGDIHQNYVLYMICGTHGLYGRNVPLYIGTTDRSIESRIGEQKWIADEPDPVRIYVAVIGKRAAHIARNDIEERSRRRREEADAEARIEENRCDFGAVKHVLQIVRCRSRRSPWTTPKQSSRVRRPSSGKSRARTVTGSCAESCPTVPATRKPKASLSPMKT